MSSEGKRGSQVFAVDIAMSLVLAVFWASIMIGLLIGRYRKPRSFLDRPFVLFLRRFSAFSDRAVVALILKQAAYGVPVVFLAPTHSRPGDWDPCLVGFAGLKLRHPWRSAPIVVRVKDETWQESAYELIQRAQTILFDTSDTSSALRTEAEMLDRAGRFPDTLCLRHVVPKASSDNTPLGGLGGLRTIEYTKSWVRALPRMLIGFLIVLAAVFFFFGASLPFFHLLPGETDLLFPVAIALAAIMYYCSVFVRPTIDRKAKVALKKALRTAAPVKREGPQRIRGWLIPAVIGLTILLIVNSYGLFTLYRQISREGVWKALTTPGSAIYHPLWRSWIESEIIGTLFIVTLAIVTFVLVFRKSKKAPAFAIALAGIYALLQVSDYYFATLIPAAVEQIGPTDPTQMVGAVAAGGIWILYFLRSWRVKATFVR